MRLSTDEYRRILSVVPIVCVDCIVVNERNQFLLVRRTNEPLKGEYWLPGGRLHKGERLADAVHRKMREELGVDVDIVNGAGYFEEYFAETAENADGGVHAISIVYVVRPKSYDFVLDSQGSEWAWFDELPVRLREYSYLNLPVKNLE
jgi:colanic acid biosynthesis protein WcaH